MLNSVYFAKGVLRHIIKNTLSVTSVCFNVDVVSLGYKHL